MTGLDLLPVAVGVRFGIADSLTLKMHTLRVFYELFETKMLVELHVIQVLSDLVYGKCNRTG